MKLFHVTNGGNFCFTINYLTLLPLSNIVENFQFECPPCALSFVYTWILALIIYFQVDLDECDPSIDLSHLKLLVDQYVRTKANNHSTSTKPTKTCRVTTNTTSSSVNSQEVANVLKLTPISSEDFHKFCKSRCACLQNSQEDTLKKYQRVCNHLTSSQPLYISSENEDHVLQPIKRCKGDSLGNQDEVDIVNLNSSTQLKVSKLSQYEPTPSGCTFTPGNADVVSKNKSLLQSHVIHAFTHPDVICVVREKLLAALQQD